MAADEFSIETLQHATVLDSQSQRIGLVHQVFVDDVTEELTFVTVITGVFGGRETLVPLHLAELTDEGVRVPYTKTEVKKGPIADPRRPLTTDEELRIYKHYGFHEPQDPTEPAEP